MPDSRNLKGLRWEWCKNKQTRSLTLGFH